MENNIEEQRIDLVNDLIATTTVMDELWYYHPENPNRKDIVEEYKVLEKIKDQIEEEIKNLG
jgi:adenine C2-methylase RlmN of 23S rRNA A2503 and tRNA A37